MTRGIANKMDKYNVHHILLNIFIIFTSSSAILKFDQMYNVNCTEFNGDNWNFKVFFDGQSQFLGILCDNLQTIVREVLHLADK